jgi:mannosyltransferase OCH1-like enzyme
MRFKKSLLKRTKYIRARVFDYPLAPLSDVVSNTKAAASAKEFNIPPVVYQTWEENLFGRRHLRALERFRKDNQDLRFVLMDRTERDAYMAKSWGHHPVHAIYCGAQFGPMRADIFRYCLLHECGGYYFDINKAVTVPIRSLHAPDTTAFLSHEHSECTILPSRRTLDLMPLPGHYIAQWAFGFAPQHSFLARTIAYICEFADAYANRTFSTPKSAILQLTGPGMFTRAVRDSLDQDPSLALQMTLLPPAFAGAGDVNIEGSDVRYLRQPPYFRKRNQPILQLDDPKRFAGIAQSMRISTDSR